MYCCDRKTLYVQHLAEHVTPCTGNVFRRRLRIEIRFRSQVRFIDGKAVERHDKVCPAPIEIDIAPDIVARDNMVMPQARKRSAAPHANDNDRLFRVDLQDPPASCLGIMVIVNGKITRQLSLSDLV